MRIQFHILVLVFLVGATGCRSWVSEDVWGGGVWSEDDQALAITRVLYERENKIFSANTRNWRFKVHTAPASNVSQVTQRGPEMEGTIQDAYYMRDLDYVLTVARLRGDAVDTIRIDQFLADGTVRQLRSVPANGASLNCAGESWQQEVTSPVQMIPSPDGAALVYVALTLGCEGMNALVEWVDPVDGATQTSETIPLESTMYHGSMGNGHRLFSLFPQFSWNESGEFMLGFDEMQGEAVTGNIVGWVIDANGSRSELPSLDSSCFTPSTTSSNYSAEGQFLNSDVQADTLWIESPGSVSDVFGCQG